MFFMLVSAGVFAYFGFGTQWSHQSLLTGQTLLFVVLLDYTLKSSAVAIGAAVLLTLIHRAAGGLLYGVVGLLGAMMFVVIAILDIRDQQHTAIDPILLFIFAAWNGFGSLASLRELLRSRQVTSGRGAAA